MARGCDYVAYGLAIRSQLELPALAEREAGPPDVRIGLGSLPVLDLPTTGWGRCKLDGDTALLDYEGTATIEVRAGREIVVDAAPGHDPELLRELVVGPALAMAAMQRGRLVLHASAVELDGLAYAFLAAGGWGKSTLAAELHARGARLVADDVAAVRIEAGKAHLVPAFPRIKLWPEALVRMGLDPTTLSPIYATVEKRSQPVDDGFLSEEVPLGGLYVLDEGEQPTIEPVAPSEAAIELVRHNYVAGPLQRSDGGSNLRRSTELARLVPMRRLRRPWRLDAVTETAALIEDDLEVEL